MSTPPPSLEVVLIWDARPATRETILFADAVAVLDLIRAFNRRRTYADASRPLCKGWRLAAYLDGDEVSLLQLQRWAAAELEAEGDWLEPADEQPPLEAVALEIAPRCVTCNLPVEFDEAMAQPTADGMEYRHPRCWAREAGE